MVAPDLLGPVRTVEDLIKQLLPSEKYKNIQFWKSGGTRDLYMAEWGPGNEKRIIKVDKSELESPRAQRHVERGYDTSNDIRALSEISNPERHNLMRLVDYFDFSKTQGITVAVERHFESQSLEERVQDKPLKLKEFETVFSQVIEGANYFINTCGMYHRDLKASNILVNDELEVRITDFANACKKNEVQKKYMPTAGGHWVSDPLVFFNGSENEYRETSEIYAIGTEMFYALTGEHIFEYDADNGTGISCFTGESLLDKNGIVDRTRHNATLDYALKRLPWRIRRKYGEVIKKSLSLDDEVRYSKISELKKDFENEKNMPSWYQYLTSRLILSSLLITTTGFAIGGVGIMHHLEKKLEETQAVAEENAKYYVKPEWDGLNLEINNNLTELDLK
ncbi:MAG: protein kinase, partial [Nanoarchaeota archaeon]|nr:protein kinase [Nanoarchaeota archaeon]